MIAWWVSLAFHPFVMVAVLVGVAAAARQPAADAARTLILVVFVTLVPLAVLMVRQVRRGAWQNADASNRQERTALYLVGTGGVALLLVYVMVARAQPFLVRGLLASLALLAACAALTPWIKVSLHMAFAAFAALGLALMRAPAGYALLCALPLVAWSRLALKRHTPAELALGTMAGAAVGTAVHYL